MAYYPTGQDNEQSLLYKIAWNFYQRAASLGILVSSPNTGDNAPSQLKYICNVTYSIATTL